MYIPDILENVHRAYISADTEFSPASEGALFLAHVVCPR